AQPTPAPVAPPPPNGMSREQLSKLLTETDVYVKYGLHDKALEHLRKVFTVDPENLDAHEKAYQIYVASGNAAQASEQLLNVLRLCTRAADSQRAQPYLATILQENPAHPEVPAFLSLRVDGPVVAAPTAAAVESVGEDAILVDSSDDEILVAPPPEDALLHPPGDELALTTLPSADSDEVIDEDGDAAVVSDEALVGDPITSGENIVYDDASEPEDLAAASLSDETLVAEDDGLVLTDEPGLGMSDDEPLVAPEDTAAYSLEDEALVDEATATSMETLSLGDEDAPPPTMVRQPSRALLDEAAPDTHEVPSLEDDTATSLEYAAASALEDETLAPMDEVAPLDVDDMPTRVGLAPLDPSMLVEEDEAEVTSLGDPLDTDEPTASHAVMALEDDTPEAEAELVEAPVVEEPEEEPVEAQAEAEPEEEPASEECDEASFFLDQGLLEEAREILETVMIAFPGHARATELMERLEALEAGGGGEAAEAAPAEPVSVPSVQPIVDTDAEAAGGRDPFDLAAELAGEIDNLGDDTASAPAAEEDFQYSVEEVFSEFKKGLAKVVKPEDVDTHYDLGIAYKEMGLLDDALHEFEVARQGCQGTKRELDCLTMTGMLQLQRGDAAAAVEAFRQGLGSTQATAEQTKALGFELAAAYEALGEPGKALFHYQRVAGMDAKYRDVAAQVSRLSASVAPEDDSPPSAAVAPTPMPAAGASRARKVGYL
ncbi:tetratricopeptide repeat protein, partial [Pyxidicoccus fallax]